MNRGRLIAAFAWPCALVVGVALAGWMALRPRAALDVRSPHLGSDAPAETFGLEGRVEELGLRVRIAPLHAEPRRQAFEARTLRERFARADGEPVRLELVLDEGARPVRLDLGAAMVVDARGTALVPLVRRVELPAPSAAVVADPLRTLLAAGEGELGSGLVATCVLWGRLPIDGAERRGRVTTAVPLAAKRWSVAPHDDVRARVPAPPDEEAGR